MFAGCGVRAVGTTELPVCVVGGGEECVWIVWSGWWNDGDCVVGLCNEAGMRRNCRGGK